MLARIFEPAAIFAPAANFMLAGCSVPAAIFVLDSRPRGRGFEPHCVVFSSKRLNPSLELVQPR